MKDVPTGTSPISDDEAIDGFATILAALLVNLVVTRIALTVVVWVAWGWLPAAITLLAMIVASRFGTSAYKRSLLASLNK